MREICGKSEKKNPVREIGGKREVVSLNCGKIMSNQGKIFQIEISKLILFLMLCFTFWRPGICCLLSFDTVHGLKAKFVRQKQQICQKNLFVLVIQCLLLFQ